MSWSGVITNAGQNLLATYAGGGHTLYLDTPKVGSGNVAAESMRNATALQSQKDSATIVKKSSISGGIRIRVQVGPHATSAYTAREIGIFAHIDSNPSVLMALHQDSGGVSVPTKAQNPDFVFGLNAVISVSNTEDLEITVDPSAYVSTTGLQEALNEQPTATTSAKGLMSASDKSKLNGIAVGANNYSHPTYTSRTGAPTENQTPGFGSTFNVGQITSDSTGHVTGANTRTVRIPNTEASTSAAGLMSASDKSKLNGIANNANNYTHPSYTGYTGQPTSNQSPGFGGSFSVSQVTTNSYGHVTGMTTRTVTIPSAVATTSSNGLMSAGDKSKLSGIAYGANNYTHPGYTAQTGKPTAAVDVTLGNPFTVSQVTSDATGHVSSMTDREVTVSHPAYTARTGAPTANQTPGFGSTFNVGQVVSDSTGHVSGITTRTVKIPNTEASASAAGLMSAADKAAFDAKAIMGKAPASGVTSLNSFTDAGVYFVNKSNIGGGWPSTASGVALLMVARGNGDTLVQILFTGISNGSYGVYLRSYYNTAWKDWLYMAPGGYTPT